MVQREMSSGLAQFEFRLGTVSNLASFENIEIWGRTKASNGEDIYFFISMERDLQTLIPEREKGKKRGEKREKREKREGREERERERKESEEVRFSRRM
jgi:hypothetical protein